MSAAARGRFITLEGGEGAGKSTQARRLAARLGETGRSVLATREPGGSPGAEAIRELLLGGATGRWDAMAELLLMTAARRAHVVETVAPALDAGTWVVCDRYVDSTVAYQGFGHGLGHEAVKRLHRLALDDLMPDVTLWLDLPVAEGLARAGARDGARGGAADRFQRFGADFHQRVREGFAFIHERAPRRVKRVDARGDEAAVAEAVGQVVAPHVEGSRKA